MVIWMLIASVLSCELPSIPLYLDYFSPDYLSYGHIEGSGRYLISSTLT